MKTYKFHYFYKITNLINNKFYFGIHSTNNLNDGYMGSGTRLKYAFEKYGKENFKKEILKYFECREDASNYEEYMITESLLNDDNCYNIRYGGDNGGTQGLISVTDKFGNRTSVFSDDPRYVSGELYPIWCGKKHTKEQKEKVRKKMTPKDSKNDRIWVNRDGKVKYLRKELLEEYIQNGWELGRSGYKPRKGKQGSLIN